MHTHHPHPSVPHHSPEAHHHHHASMLAHKACHRFLALNYVNLVHKTHPTFHSEHGWMVEFSITGDVFKNRGIVFENTNNPNFHFYLLKDCRVNSAGSKDDLFPSSQPVTDFIMTNLYTQLTESSINNNLQLCFPFVYDLEKLDPVTGFADTNKTLHIKICFPVHH